MAIEEVGKLKNLDFIRQLTFAYLTCERLYPNYVYFSDNYRFGSPDVLRDAIDYLYINLFNSKPDKTKIYSLITNLDKNTPEPGNFETELASAALDACGVVYESLNFLLDKQPSRLDSISIMATDTVDMYIQDKDELDFNADKYFQKKIETHPLMKKEIAIQSGIITFLSNSTKINLEDIHTLLQLQENQKKGNLDL